MGIDRAKQQARWRRNKEAERRRNVASPCEVPTPFIQAVFEERDKRRAVSGIAGTVMRPHHNFHEQRTFEQAITFAANVWAADTILEAQWGQRGSKPRRVAEWFEREGIAHSYSAQSFPKMLRKARERIKRLEEPQPWNLSGMPIWAPFKP